MLLQCFAGDGVGFSADVIIWWHCVISWCHFCHFWLQAFLEPWVQEWLFCCTRVRDFRVSTAFPCQSIAVVIEMCLIQVGSSIFNKSFLVYSGAHYYTHLTNWLNCCNLVNLNKNSIQQCPNAKTQHVLSTKTCATCNIVVSHVAPSSMLCAVTQ